MTKKDKKKNTKQAIGPNGSQDQSIVSLASCPPLFSTFHFQGIYDNKFKNQYVNLRGGKYRWNGPTCKDRLALVMMIKNEEKRITVSMDSVKDICSTFVILDTGSTDRTIEIVRTYAQTHNITLHLKELPFVDFEKSRNDLLDFADEILQYHYFLLMLDCNDELRNHDELVKHVENYKGEQTGFYIRQQWWTGSSLDTYFNNRMVISHFGWRYKGVVHEVCMRDTDDNNTLEQIYKCENVILFQDRTKDDDKTMKRFKRDKDLLYNAYLKNPKDARTLFYLAQTCSCLNQHQEAYEYYILRIKEVGFWEEVYQCYSRLGNLSKILGHPWEESMSWYLKAYSVAKRAEPLVSIAEYYQAFNIHGERKPDWHLAYMFIKQACCLTYPNDQNLFIDKQVYIYKRWHLMGIIAYYVNRYQEGYDACIRALMAKDTEIDMNNLVFYVDKIEQNREMAKQNKGPLRTDMHMMASFDNLDHFHSSELGMTVGAARSKDEVLQKFNEYKTNK